MFEGEGSKWPKRHGHTLIYSTHIDNLDLPWMPDSMTVTHIVPGLSHSALLSTKVFYDAGYKLIFGEWECRVYYEAKFMLTGYRDRKTGM